MDFLNIEMRGRVVARLIMIITFAHYVKSANLKNPRRK